MILSGQYPTEGKITLEIPNRKLVKAEGQVTGQTQKGNLVTITVPQSAFNDKTIEVLTLQFDQPIEPQPMNVVKGNALLTATNATPNYSYSCFDYYSNYRSTVSYSWNIEKNGLRRMELLYTPQEEGKTIELTLDGQTQQIRLGEGKAIDLPNAPVTWGARYLCGPGSSVFDAPSTLQTDLQTPPAKRATWQPVEKEQDEFQANIMQTYFLMQEIESERAQNYLVEVGAGNGIEVILNGVSLMKHLNPYRCTFRKELVLLPLQKGKNQIVLRVYNRFEKKTGYLLRPADAQTVYAQSFTWPEAVAGKAHTLTVRQCGLPSQHTDTELANLRIQLK